MRTIDATFFAAFLSLQWILVLARPANDIVVDRLVSRQHYNEDSDLVRRDTGFSNGGSSSNTGENAKNFAISIYHVNDLHARLDEFRPSGSSCPDPSRGCVGGYPRIKTVIDRERPSKPHSLFLNAGDEFQGTLFYTLYKGEATSSILNQMGFDAMTLGNHEFDDGDDLLATFLSNLTFPVISANIQTTNEKLARNIAPYKVFNTGKYRGMDLAVVAVTTETTKVSSNPGEGTTFEDPVAAVKRTVDYIKRRHRGIKRFIALTHIGYAEDIRLARESTDISLIVGGHSHTLLADNSTVPSATGPYPTIVKNSKGEEVFVVTSYRWGEYLGYIDLEYDNNGRVIRYEGAPIHLKNDVPEYSPEDGPLKAEVQKWAEGFEALTRQIVGRTETTLDQATCQDLECTMGNFAGDAIAGMAPSNLTSPFVNRTGTAPAPSAATFAGGLFNAGGLRSAIEAGNISFQNILEVFPFGNTLTELEFTSAQLWNAFESIVSKSNVDDPSIPVLSFVQVSESIRFTYNVDAPVGSRLRSLTVANGENVVEGDAQKTWIVATNNYLAAGGDGFWAPRDSSQWSTLDSLEDVAVNYLRGLGRLQGAADGIPDVRIELDGRIGRVTT